MHPLSWFVLIMIPVFAALAVGWIMYNGIFAHEESAAHPPHNDANDSNAAH
jgi:hypothetical protein